MVLHHLQQKLKLVRWAAYCSLEHEQQHIHYDQLIIDNFHRFNSFFIYQKDIVMFPFSWICWNKVFQRTQLTCQTQSSNITCLMLWTSSSLFYTIVVVFTIFGQSSYHVMFCRCTFCFVKQRPEKLVLGKIPNVTLEFRTVTLETSNEHDGKPLAMKVNSLDRKRPRKMIVSSWSSW